MKLLVVEDEPSLLASILEYFTQEDFLCEGVFILDKVSESRGGNPSAATSVNVSNTLDIKMLDQLIGAKGELSKGVYKYTIGRPDVHLLDHGVKVSTFLGFNTWAAWQGSPEKQPLQVISPCLKMRLTRL